MNISNQENYSQLKIKLLDVMQYQILQNQRKLLFISLMDDMKNFSDKKIDQQEYFMKCLESWWVHNPLVSNQYFPSSVKF